MKKENFYKYLYFLDAAILISFLITVLFDYFLYDDMINSAPFSAFLIVRVVEFILPCIIIFIIATVLRKKFKK